jgi:thymidine phosphorylase
MKKGSDPMKEREEVYLHEEAVYKLVNAMLEQGKRIIEKAGKRFTSGRAWGKVTEFCQEEGGPPP